MTMIVRYDQMYPELICEDVPRRQLRSFDDGDGYENRKREPMDPWDGTKPYAEDGFVAKYCMSD